MKIRIMCYCILVVFILGILISQTIQKDSKASASYNALNGDKVYIIDAGHGGEDGGALAPNGMKESDFNLQIATKVNDLLRLFGYRTVMLRPTDDDLHTTGNSIAERKRSDLAQRVQIVNHYANAVLISIHQNNFNDERYFGLQTFYYKEGSKALAEHIQNAYRQYINPSSRRLPQVKKNVYLLKNTKCDAVLVECGFLSNPMELDLLQSEIYQCKLGIIITFSVVKNAENDDCVN